MTPDTEPSPAAEPEEQRTRVLRWLVVLAALVLAGVVVGVIVYGYLARPGWVGVSDKRFWDYLELLIVPAALAIGVYWLNRAQREREREAEAVQQERERVAEEARRERELEVENQRAQDEALQAYLDQISQLLADKERPLGGVQPGDPLSTVTRARTLTVLDRLDGYRKRNVLRFLYESDLITRDRAVLYLDGANLRDAFLRNLDLPRADLRGTVLSRADLSGALGGAVLDQADLSGALMDQADLRMASLRGTILHGAVLSEADLGGAVLDEADLSGAFLGGGVVIDRDDRRTYVSGARRLTERQLKRTKSLKGATMPNGQKYEDWLKSKGSGEDGENTGAS